MLTLSKNAKDLANDCVTKGGEILARHLERPAHVENDDYRIYVVISYLTYLGISIHALLIPIFYFIGHEFLSLFNVLSTLSWVLARKLNNQGSHTTAVVILFTEVALHTTLALLDFGWQSGFQYYLMAGVPFILFNHRMKIAPSLILSALLCTLFIGLYAFTSVREYHHSYPPVVSAINYANIIASFLALTITSYYFRVASFISEQKMELLANTDLLTELPNRRGMYQQLHAHHELFIRRGVNFSVVLTDIDHFKRINDTYGHDCGDYILREIARLFRGRFRQYDAISRWGGEEFLFMHPDTNEADAASIAEEIRHAIETHRFIFNDHPIYITMTFGVAQHMENSSIDGTIKRADDALYEGKQTGRNRVVVATEPA